MNKSIKLNSGNILNMKKNIDATKKKYWKIIRAENVMTNKAIKAGIGSGKDLKALYNEITQMAEKLIYIKGMLFYLNMGITKFDKEAFKKTNNYNIFAACEVKEIIAQLKMVPTIDPKLKAAKSLKGVGKKESFTSAKIASLLKDLQLKANKFDSNMEEFNTSTSIEITDALSDIEQYLAA